MSQKTGRAFRALARRLTYANVIATIALFAALGTGGAYAATQLSNNSVKTKHISNNAVTSAKIKDGAITAKDISRRARRSLAGKPGPAGPPGPQGVQGYQGPPGITVFATVERDGSQVSGTTAGAQRTDNGVYRVQAGRVITGCAVTATLAALPGKGAGPAPLAPPPGGSATVEQDPNQANDVIVRTWDADGSAAASGFNLTIACR